MADIEALRQKIASAEALIEAHRRSPALYLGQLEDLNVVREHLAALKDELKLECESQAKKEITPMTDTLSEREKELVEAARDVRSGFTIYGDTTVFKEAMTRMRDALKAYDPKPEPVPVIPSWEEFVNIIARDPSVAGVALKDPDFLRIDEAQYNAIRKATARMPD